MNPNEYLMFYWETMEQLQDKYQYFELGWYGFIPMVIMRF